MKIKNIVMIILLVSTMSITGLVIGQDNATNQSEKQHDVYYCPMHPQILYDHPGNCPICGMQLIKKEPQAANKKAPCSCCGMRRS